MASPPPYGNPDTRELPPGWITQWNPDYKAWFYVNTREQPPRSSWEHPLGPMQTQFAPPPGPPNREWSRSPYGGGQSNYPPSQQYGGGGYGPGYQPSYGGPQGGYGGPQGGYGGPPQGGFGGGSPYAPGPPGGGYQQGYQPESNRGFFGGNQQPAYAQAPPKKSGPGIGTALLAGGAGLVGGALLMDAIEDHNEDERQEGYDQGFQNGENYADNNDYGGGGDFGGDDW
ncbi:hypothetical protein BV22DRAFT_1195641 [Leucogyrophana mollusca]|uniref:Uncharacterized protein n=1 Tax=Leucogyrophana mollusca TaxID=85980 RepID=A0ACB8BG34_9AGAM|nr:hypothetical protein BV22DRAFT_1195641 [Leucogyrophana mollusca]